MNTTVTFSRILAFLALVVFIVTAVVCFMSTDVSNTHILGGLAIGLALMAAATIV